MADDFKKYLIMGAGLAVGFALAGLALSTFGKGLKL